MKIKWNSLRIVVPVIFLIVLAFYPLRQRTSGHYAALGKIPDQITDSNLMVVPIVFKSDVPETDLAFFGWVPGTNSAISDIRFDLMMPGSVHITITTATNFEGSTLITILVGDGHKANDHKSFKLTKNSSKLI